MVTRFTGCSVLDELVGIALPICQAAECCVRPGPGRPRVVPEWVMMVLVVVAVANRRHSKSVGATRTVVAVAGHGSFSIRHDVL